MYTFSNKQLRNALSVCALLTLSLPSWATVVIVNPLPPPGTTTSTLVTSCKKVSGKQVCTTDPTGTGDFKLDFHYDPLHWAPDTSVGYNGVEFLDPYAVAQDLSDNDIYPEIEFASFGTHPTPTGFIRNITGRLTNSIPAPDLFTVTFISLDTELRTTQFRGFANTLPNSDPNASYLDIIKDGVFSERIWGNSGRLIGIGGVTDVPEPSLMVLFGMGFASLSTYRVYRKNRTV